MAHIEHEIYVSLGKYTETDGKQRTRKRKVGAIMRSDENNGLYISLDAMFNFAAVERRYGSDKIYLTCTPVGK